MEMERINENTISVLVDSNDLEERGIKILDLLSDHKQIQDFFLQYFERSRFYSPISG